jgi:hypothetical protein
MNRYPIYIPSKGRSETNLTPKILLNEGLQFYLVVEPKDYDEYQKHFDPNIILVLPKNDGGVGYVRRFIKEHSTKNGDRYHWQIDDNIKGFKVRMNNKNETSTANNNLTLVEDFIDSHDNVGIGGLRHIVYAWTKTEDYTYNQQCVSCVIINNDIQSNWRDDVIDDTDFSLQVLNEGFSTIIFNKLVMDKLPMKKLSGGCTELYYNDDTIRNRRQQRLKELWPNVFEIVIKNGVSRVKPSKIWRTFKQRPIPKI